MSETTVNYCANHPNVETNLRCNNCGKFICAKCAVLTPTGYRCKECLRGQQKIFETAQPGDYFVAFIVAVLISTAGGFVVSLLTSFLGFFTLFIGPAVGGIIAQAVRSATGKRRSLRMFQIVAIGVVAGGLPFLLRPILFLLAGGSMGVLFAVLWPVVYISFATSTAYYRLSGIEIGRR